MTSVDEDTSYQPSSYYGFTKAASAHLIDMLRRKQNLWGVTAILFNHESTRRSVQFLSRKVTSFVAGVCRHKGKHSSSSEIRIEIQDANARVDWSAATDIVRAMHLSLQADSARYYVLASGELVRELLDEAFWCVGLQWTDYTDVSLTSVATSFCLIGDSKRAREQLGWVPQKTFSNLIREMVAHDLSELGVGSK